MSDDKVTGVDYYVELALDDIKEWVEDNPDYAEHDLQDQIASFADSAAPIMNFNIWEVANRDFNEIMLKSVDEIFEMGFSPEKTLIEAVQMSIYMTIVERVQNAANNWVEERNEALEEAA